MQNFIRTEKINLTELTHMLMELLIKKPETEQQKRQIRRLPSPVRQELQLPHRSRESFRPSITKQDA